MGMFTSPGSSAAIAGGMICKPRFSAISPDPFEDESHARMN